MDRLDAEPALYKGLGVTALVRLLLAFGLVWAMPAVLAAYLTSSGSGVLIAFLVYEIVLVVASVFVITAATRRLLRGRPFNYMNRRLAMLSRSTTVLQRQGEWSL